MRNAKLLVLTVVLGGLLLLAVAGPAAAGSYKDARYPREARHVLKHATKELRDAQRRAAHARYVLRETRWYSALYGQSVGRWVWLALDVGWPKSQLGTLMMVVRRESNGDPQAKNPSSTASGLLQFLSSWWEDKWDPFDPRTNLRHGYLAWRQAGWAPWALTAW